MTQKPKTAIAILGLFFKYFDQLSIPAEKQ